MATDPQRAWEISYSLARLLAESDNAIEVLEKSLGYLGEALNWDTGGIWRTDYENVQAVNAVVWHRNGVNVSRFEAITRVRKFQIGEGLPGQVWLNREPFCTDELERHPNFPRQSIARLEGLNSAVALPIMIGNRVLGVLEFFTRARRRCDEAEIGFMESLCNQLAVFLERVRVEEALTGADAQFQALAETALDAVVTIDEESTILFVNRGTEKLFGYARRELEGQKLTMLMPVELRARHEAGIRRYLESSQRNISWDGVVLPALHRNGTTIPCEIRFGQFTRMGRRFFSGFIRPVSKNNAK
jgi:PAS domain S-box-containing protein